MERDGAAAPDDDQVGDTTEAPRLHPTTPAGDTPAGPGDALLDAGAPSGGVLGRRVPGWVFAVLAALAVLGSLSFVFKESGFLRIEPGPVFDLTEAVHGDIEDPDFENHPEMLLTTVRAVPLRWWEYAREKVSPTPDTQIVAEVEAPTGPGSNGAAQMRVSKDTALAVASWLAGRTPAPTPVGAKVIGVTPASPAEAAGLQVGDTVTALGGTTVTEPRQLADAVAASQGTVTLSVDSMDGASREVEVTPRTDAEGVRRIGVEVTPALSASTQPQLDAHLEKVGGPSGGLMLTLAFIDALGAGDLTGGSPIAGTGTINADGTVGAIAGASDKVSAARSAGARVFFAPEDNARSLRDTEGIEVVAVGSVGDALEWLCSHGATDEVCSPG